jgi:hypothetical protein
MQIGIGEFVRSYADKIFQYCGDHPDELARLMDKEYSNRVFKLHLPFCMEESRIPHKAKGGKRYWTSRSYPLNGARLLICSEWHERNRRPFCDYLEAKGIIGGEELSGIVADLGSEPQPATRTRSRASANGIMKKRYKSRHEDNAANAVIRAILSNLGPEIFGLSDWEETKGYFLNRCAYYDENNPKCDEETPTHRDHIIPINKDELGEHRLGNFVPSCGACNQKKHFGDFRVVFAGQPETIKLIEEYMASRRYTPIGDNQQIKIIVDQAYNEVKALVYRYITIIEGVFRGI